MGLIVLFITTIVAIESGLLDLRWALPLLVTLLLGVLADSAAA